MLYSYSICSVNMLQGSERSHRWTSVLSKLHVFYRKHRMDRQDTETVSTDVAHTRWMGKVSLSLGELLLLSYRHCRVGLHFLPVWDWLDTVLDVWRVPLSLLLHCLLTVCVHSLPYQVLLIPPKLSSHTPTYSHRGLSLLLLPPDMSTSTLSISRCHSICSNTNFYVNFMLTFILYRI